MCYEQSYEQIIEKFGSMEGFFNCSEDSLLSEKEQGGLDEGMYEICMFFRNNGYKSALSCSGHGKGLAYIKFCTSVGYEELYRFCSRIPVNIRVLLRRHKWGFNYVEIRFRMEELWGYVNVNK